MDKITYWEVKYKWIVQCYVVKKVKALVKPNRENIFDTWSEAQEAADELNAE